MDCNKEEATRAKGIAERKMENKDFVGAKKVILRAQRLFPDLENISQMLTVCDLHCFAEKKVLGAELDYYSILQVEHTADDACIKKQYRKLALLLHPDKNKFPGAEDAFKMIGEAQRLFSNFGKKSVYDIKYRAFFKTSITSQQLPKEKENKKSNVTRESGINNVNIAELKVPGGNSNQAHQQELPNGLNTFWTLCPFCKARSQYYKDICNKTIRCHNCMNPFVARDMNSQDVPPLHQQREGSENSGPRFGLNTVFQGNLNYRATSSEPVLGNVGSLKVSNGSKSKGKENENGSRNDGNGKTPDMKKKGPQVIAETGGTFVGNICTTAKKTVQTAGLNASASEPLKRSVVDSEVGNASKPNGKKHNEDKKRPEVNDEQTNTSKKRPVIDEQMINANNKRSKVVLESFEDFGVEINTNTGKEKTFHTSGLNSGSSGSKTILNPEYIEVPDSEFYNFDIERDKECFEVDQMWAVYDNLDGMPRYYARIRKVFTPGFKVRITWLEANPDKKDEIDWLNEDLPVACGNFEHGISEITEDIGMFSHLVVWENGTCRNSYKIHPKMGEIWALFENWNINWSSDPDNHRMCQFEFVEVLSDFSEGSGVRVVYLIKVEGFLSLFRRIVENDVGAFQVPPNELFRFSHRVPSFRTTGSEMNCNCAPQGYFELDPASLRDIHELDNSKDVKVNCSSSDSIIHGFVANSPTRGRTDTNVESSSKGRNCSPGNSNAALKSQSNVAMNENGNQSDESQPLVFDPSETPETEFHNFTADRSGEKIQPGQIWSLYCDLDALPKYYALIDKVEQHPKFKLYIKWIEPCPLSKVMLQWSDKEIPVCCGMFKLSNLQAEVRTDTTSFSHQITAKPTAKTSYEIYPTKGEIWAIFKNFNVKWSCSDLGKCEYDIVEVDEDDGSSIRVVVLKKVDEFETVFRAQRNGGALVTLVISRLELIRFSHRVPAFHLTEKIDHSLSGCWELDPNSTPVHFFRSS
ncbi:hypothetical protein GIB67_006799 [Kingdonia uniflora]|uniref:J domain-containing protein n=1 Tax=Kingdonia uniflora TaxID=39325 RepID=A0A7J7KZZ1_9MAGN|nr:hypothetical protein GIB67_006799 [Kingdonia uniflora]